MTVFLLELLMKSKFWAKHRSKRGILSPCATFELNSLKNNEIIKKLRIYYAATVWNMNYVIFLFEKWRHTHYQTRWTMPL